ncbi:hypothetical protein ACFOY2_45925 [Nonomuraea purpurea]|uniref:Uncharacterized protein n=1 Tax=Nonomuraea purpurea TaxID=1849276 RepID=A0ABV8GL01_9ACTN
MTITAIAAPDDDNPDAVRLLSLPPGVKLPRLADYAVPATMPDSPESIRLEALALANLAIERDLDEGFDGTPEDAERRESHLLHFHAMLAAATADFGDINIAVTERQAREIANAAHDLGRNPAAKVIELDPAVIWNLLDAAGHGEHGGWTHDPRWPEITCACGDAVLRITVPAAPTTR